MRTKSESPTCDQLLLLNGAISVRRGGAMTNSKKFCAVIGLISLCASSAFAQEERNEAVQAAVEDMAKEMVECAVYFDIVAAVLRSANERTTSLKYVDAYKLAVARADSLSPGVVKAQYAVLVKEMTHKVVMANIPKKIEENLSNVSMLEISVLQDQYGKLCKDVMNAPGERAKYWMQHTGAPAP